LELKIMSLFKNNTTISQPHISIHNEDFMIIYNYLKSGLDETNIFINHQIPTNHSKWVKDRITLIERTTLGEISKWKDTNPTYTQEDIEEYINTKYPDQATPSIIVSDIIKYNPTIDLNRTFEDFKIYYTNSQYSE